MKKQLLTTFDYLIMWRLYVVIFKTHLDYYYLCVSCIQVKRTFLAKKNFWVLGGKKCDDGHRY